MVQSLRLPAFDSGFVALRCSRSCFRLFRDSEPQLRNRSEVLLNLRFIVSERFNGTHAPLLKFSVSSTLFRASLQPKSSNLLTLAHPFAPTPLNLFKFDLRTLTPLKHVFAPAKPSQRIISSKIPSRSPKRQGVTSQRYDRRLRNHVCVRARFRSSMAAIGNS